MIGQMSKPSDYRKILSPSIIAKLKTLEIKAKTVVEGFMVGYHKSPYHGFSVEFSQHRPYMQGDSIKNYLSNTRQTGYSTETKPLL